ncbi:MAG: hypothetical protein WEB55_03545, partial [Acidimicrobiia bacterium]
MSQSDQTLTVRMRLLLVAAIVAFTAAFAILVWTDVTREGGEGLGETLSLTLGFASFFGIGMTIASRRPDHPIGWLFLAAGTYPLVQAALSELGEMQMEEGSATLFVIAHTAFSWPALLGTLVVFVPLLFPTGRLPSPRWRWLAWTAGAAMGVMVVGGVFQRDVCLSYDDANACVESIANPWGFSWLPNVEESA